MTSLEGVIPCPVCGSTPTLDKLHTRGGWGYVFRCATCPPPILGSKICYTHQEAKMDWNAKASPPT